MGPEDGVTAAAPAAEAQQEMEQRAANTARGSGREQLAIALIGG